MTAILPQMGGVWLFTVRVKFFHLPDVPDAGSVVRFHAARLLFVRYPTRDIPPAHVCCNITQVADVIVIHFAFSSIQS